MNLATIPPTPALIVGGSGKRLKVLTIDTWKKLLRLRREAAAEGFRTVFDCQACGQRITLTVPSKTDPRLECGCTQWVGR